MDGAYISLKKLMSQQCCSTCLRDRVFNAQTGVVLLLTECTDVHLCLAGDGALHLSDIMFFATGVWSIPPVGFSPQLSVQFLRDAEGNGVHSSYPKANTCTCCLWLPVMHSSYEAFSTAFTFGIQNSQGSGYA